MFESIEKALDRKPPEDETQALLDAEPFMVEYRNKIGLTALSIALAFLGLGGLYLSAQHMRPPALVLLDDQGRQSQLQTMPLPNQSREAVKDWAREAIQKTYTFDFTLVDKEFAGARQYFTPEAWELFKTTFGGSELVADVRKDKLTVSVVLHEDPMVESSIRSKGDGEVAWKVLAPVTMSFSGDAPTQTKTMLVRLTVVRVPTTENPKGLGVQQMTAGPLP
jgi:intracellular multiplication protein IcmL